MQWAGRMRASVPVKLSCKNMDKTADIKLQQSTIGY